MNKSELLNEINRRRDQVELRLKPFSAEQIDKLIAQGKWTIKNVLAHVTFWDERLVQRLNAYTRGEQIPPLTEEDDTINERVYQATCNESAQETVAKFWRVYQELNTYVQNTSETQLTQRSALVPDRVVAEEIIDHLGHLDEHLLTLPAPVSY